MIQKSLTKSLSVNQPYDMSQTKYELRSLFVAVELAASSA